jgi:hypothetical protein
MLSFAVHCIHLRRSAHVHVVCQGQVRGWQLMRTGNNQLINTVYCPRLTDRQYTAWHNKRLVPHTRFMGTLGEQGQSNACFSLLCILVKLVSSQ